MDNLAEKESIMIGPPARGGGARHDIMLPGHQRTNNITPGKLSQPSYLTEIHIQLVSWNLRLRGSERKKVQHKSSKWHCKILEKWTMGAGFWSNSSSLNQGEDKEVSGELNGNSPRFPKDGFPPLSEQGDNICQIKWYKEVCSRKTYTIKHWLKGAPEIWG